MVEVYLFTFSRFHLLLLLLYYKYYKYYTEDRIQNKNILVFIRRIELTTSALDYYYYYYYCTIK